MIPGLLRRLSWQQLLVHLERDADLAWLTTALEAKYGLVPANRASVPFRRAQGHSLKAPDPLYVLASLDKGEPRENRFIVPA
jgi:hypothetical protein